MRFRALCGLLLVLLAGCALQAPAPESGDDAGTAQEDTHYRTATGAPAWMPTPSTLAPMSGRVGVMSLLGNELRHVHAGTTRLGGSVTNFQVQFDINGYVQEELRKSLLTRTPYQPVAVAPTGALLRAGTSWQETWDGKQFAPTFQREFDGIIKQNRLVMLIVVAYADMGDRLLGSGAHLAGSGLYTRSFLGKSQAAVFSTMQFYRIAGEPAQLVTPVAPAGERSIGDLDIPLPDDLEHFPERYLAPVYGPLRIIVQNKIDGLISLPRRVGQ